MLTAILRNSTTLKLPQIIFSLIYCRVTHKQGIQKKVTVNSKALEQYDAIKLKQNNKSKLLTPEMIEKQYKTHRCDGCNSILQSEDKLKFGFVDNKILKEALSTNKNLIEQSYGIKASKREAKTLDILHEVQNQLGVKIFNETTNSIEKLDSVEVLLRLQEKIDEFEENQQTIRKSKKARKEIFCYRCYTLKYHNRLPSEYDIKEEYPLNNKEAILNKLFIKHKTSQVMYLFLVDILDVLGSFQEDILGRLMTQNAQFAIVINKLDVANEKYVNKHLVLRQVKQIMRKVASHNSYHHDRVNQISIFLTSSVTRAGLENIQQFLEKSKVKKVQLLGLPNTGKTTLLNSLAKLSKPVSKVPGTTLHITQHSYGKSRLIYDMPGVFVDSNLYNLIDRPNLKSLLTWDKHYSPPIMTHHAFFYGGKVEIEGARILVFALGGACSSDNKWFLLNYQEFWKGLPPFSSLQITKYQQTIQFVHGRAPDLEIAGLGFISFRLCEANVQLRSKKLTFYLPKNVQYSFRESVVKDLEMIHWKSSSAKRHMLQRVHTEKASKLQKGQKVRQK